MLTPTWYLIVEARTKVCMVWLYVRGGEAGEEGKAKKEHNDDLLCAGHHFF